MAKSKQEIINEIFAHIKKEGSGYKAWYVGITNNIKRRFKEHNVSFEQGKDWWVYEPAISEEVAREIEQHFISLGCDGGGDKGSNIIYAYKKTSETEP